MIKNFMQIPQFFTNAWNTISTVLYVPAELLPGINIATTLLGLGFSFLASEGQSAASQKLFNRIIFNVDKQMEDFFKNSKAIAEMFAIDISDNTVDGLQLDLTKTPSSTIDKLFNLDPKANNIGDLRNNAVRALQGKSINALTDAEIDALFNLADPDIAKLTKLRNEKKQAIRNAQIQTLLEPKIDSLEKKITKNETIQIFEDETKKTTELVQVKNKNDKPKAKHPKLEDYKQLSKLVGFDFKDFEDPNLNLSKEQKEKAKKAWESFYKTFKNYKTYHKEKMTLDDWVMLLPTIGSMYSLIQFIAFDINKWQFITPLVNFTTIGIPLPEILHGFMGATYSFSLVGVVFTIIRGSAGQSLIALATGRKNTPGDTIKNMKDLVSIAGKIFKGEFKEIPVNDWMFLIGTVLNLIVVTNPSIMSSVAVFITPAAPYILIFAMGLPIVYFAVSGIFNKIVELAARFTYEWSGKAVLIGISVSAFIGAIALFPVSPGYAILVGLVGVAGLIGQAMLFKKPTDPKETEEREKNVRTVFKFMAIGAAGLAGCWAVLNYFPGAFPFVMAAIGLATFAAGFILDRSGNALDKGIMDVITKKTKLVARGDTGLQKFAFGTLAFLLFATAVGVGFLAVSSALAAGTAVASVAGAIMIVLAAVSSILTTGLALFKAPGKERTTIELILGITAVGLGAAAVLLGSPIITTATMVVAAGIMSLLMRYVVTIGFQREYIKTSEDLDRKVDTITSRAMEVLQDTFKSLNNPDDLNAAKTEFKDEINKMKNRLMPITDDPTFKEKKTEVEQAIKDVLQKDEHLKNIYDIFKVNKDIESTDEVFTKISSEIKKSIEDFRDKSKLKLSEHDRSR